MTRDALTFQFERNGERHDFTPTLWDGATLKFTLPKERPEKVIVCLEGTPVMWLVVPAHAQPGDEITGDFCFA